MDINDTTDDKKNCFFCRLVTFFCYATKKNNAKIKKTNPIKLNPPLK